MHTDRGTAARTVTTALLLYAVNTALPSSLTQTSALPLSHFSRSSSSSFSRFFAPLSPTTARSALTFACASKPRMASARCASQLRRIISGQAPVDEADEVGGNQATARTRPNEPDSCSDVKNTHNVRSRASVQSIERSAGLD